jgi:hypothetical protein
MSNDKTKETLGDQMKKIQTSDARRARLLLAAACGKIAQALELKSPAATSAADHVKLRARRNELSKLLRSFDERHGLDRRA